MNQESTAFAVGCCDLEWTKDAGSPSRVSLADQVRCGMSQNSLTLFRGIAMNAHVYRCSTLWGVCGILRRSRPSHAATDSALGPRIITTRMVSNPPVPGCFLLAILSVHDKSYVYRLTLQHAYVALTVHSCLSTRLGTRSDSSATAGGMGHVTN